MMVFKTQMHIFTSSQAFTELMGYDDCTVNTETHRKFELWTFSSPNWRECKFNAFPHWPPFWDLKAMPSFMYSL